MFCFSFTWTAGGCPSLESLIIRMRAGCARLGGLLKYYHRRAA
jgi:hypothetical protein